MGAGLDSALALLNGLVGDELERRGNGLVTPMACVHRGHAIAIDREALARAYTEPTPRVVLLVHGLMCTEAVWEFQQAEGHRQDRDYGALLADDLGFTPMYLRYNSGLAIADNGEALSELLEALLVAYPVALEEILLIGHSLGGLVVRSACEHARASSQRWLALVRRAIFIDTPHLGAPLERLGRIAAGLLRAVPDPYTRLAADIGDLRSDAINDLGDADLRHEDRARRRVGIRSTGWRHPVPLSSAFAHYVIAGTPPPRRPVAAALNDLLVPESSVTAQHMAVPPDRLRVFPGVGHLQLARHPEVYAQIRAWCEAAS